MPTSSAVASASASPATVYYPVAVPAPTTLFYTSRESGDIAEEMDQTLTGLLTNETLVYDVSPYNNSWGWITGPNVPGILSWPAATYTVTLNIAQPNPAVQINQLRIYRVDACGGPHYIGLLSLGFADGLNQPLTNAGLVTFTVNGIASTGDATDRLAVKFYTANTSSTVQSFSYSVGPASGSQVVVQPLPSPSPSPLPSLTPAMSPTPVASLTPVASPVASPAASISPTPAPAVSCGPSPSATP